MAQKEMLEGQDARNKAIKAYKSGDFNTAKQEAEKSVTAAKAALKVDPKNQQAQLQLIQALTLLRTISPESRTNADLKLILKTYRNLIVQGNKAAKESYNQIRSEGLQNRAKYEMTRGESSYEVKRGIKLTDHQRFSNAEKILERAKGYSDNLSVNTHLYDVIQQHINLLSSSKKPENQELLKQLEIKKRNQVNQINTLVDQALNNRNNIFDVFEAATVGLRVNKEVGDQSKIKNIVHTVENLVGRRKNINADILNSYANMRLSEALILATDRTQGTNNPARKEILNIFNQIDDFISQVQINKKLSGPSLDKLFVDVLNQKIKVLQEFGINRNESKELTKQINQLISQKSQYIEEARIKAQKVIETGNLKQSNIADILIVVDLLKQIGNESLSEGKVGGARIMLEAANSLVKNVRVKAQEQGLTNKDASFDALYHRELLSVQQIIEVHLGIDKNVSPEQAKILKNFINDIVSIRAEVIKSGSENISNKKGNIEFYKDLINYSLLKAQDYSEKGNAQEAQKYANDALQYTREMMSFRGGQDAEFLTNVWQSFSMLKGKEGSHIAEVKAQANQLIESNLPSLPGQGSKDSSMIASSTTANLSEKNNVKGRRAKEGRAHSSQMLQVQETLAEGTILKQIEEGKAISRNIYSELRLGQSREQRLNNLINRLESRSSNRDLSGKEIDRQRIQSLKNELEKLSSSSSFDQQRKQALKDVMLQVKRQAESEGKTFNFDASQSATSLIVYDSIVNGTRLSEAIRSVAELGAGGGKTTFNSRMALRAVEDLGKNTNMKFIYTTSTDASAYEVIKILEGDAIRENISSKKRNFVRYQKGMDIDSAELNGKLIIMTHSDLLEIGLNTMKTGRGLDRNTLVVADEIHAGLLGPG
ncbi:MAG TPA: hypothetical protein PKH98_02725, partial [Candidatus Omnitrophota bacterium]|nr:hypothetical protein [Candidatus Omnitrophota bacterium]